MKEIRCKNISDNQEYICYQFVMGGDYHTYGVCSLKDGDGFLLVPFENLKIIKPLNESKRMILNENKKK